MYPQGVGSFEYIHNFYNRSNTDNIIATDTAIGGNELSGISDNDFRNGISISNLIVEYHKLED